MSPEQRAIVTKQNFLKTIGISQEKKIQQRPKTLEEKKEMAKLVKEEFLAAYQKTTLETIKLIEKNREEKKNVERTRSRLGALSYMEASGDMKGMAKFMKDGKQQMFSEKLERVMNSKLITEQE